ncbi:DUF362 domain-containing protein [Candidatus Micrarchaeota archaeon]|nr:DUF362 domain-containing protein [Candidatus Micrarchaeota archaeon]
MILEVYDTEEGYAPVVRKIFEKHLSRIKRNSRILIKADLYGGAKSPESGAVTNLELVEELVRDLNKLTPREIIVADSGNIMPTFKAFELQGFSDLKTRYRNLRLVDFDLSQKIKVQNDRFIAIKNISLPEELILCDYFINIANFKRHVSERVSGCSINLYNCIPDRQTKIRYLPIVGSVINDLVVTTKPFLNILDCTIVLQGSGPVEGEPVRLNRLVVSDEPALADAAACKLIGDDPNRVPHLRELACRKLKSKSLEEIHLVKRVEFINSFPYSLVRCSLFLKKLGLYLENLAYLFFLVSFVFISIGPKNLIRGRWVPFNEYFKTAWTIFSKFEEPNNLLNWKITINKHVEQESIS